MAGNGWPVCGGGCVVGGTIGQGDCGFCNSVGLGIWGGCH